MAEVTSDLRRSRPALPSWAQIGYVLRRWPVAPIVILAILIVVGAFAPLFAPYDPLLIDLPARNTPPFWVEAETEPRLVAQRIDKLSSEDRDKISLRDALKKGFTEAEVGDTIIKGMVEVFNAKTVTYDFHRLMEGATLFKCSEFAAAITENFAAK